MNQLDEDPTPTQVEDILADMDRLTQFEMAWLWRNAPVGHPYFSDPELFAVFEKKFAERGGMTPAISKQIGW